MSENRKPKKRGFLKFLKVLGILVGILLLCVISLFLYLTVVEYSPEPTEKVAVEGTALTNAVQVGESMSVLSWNVGYGALGDNADFFMDGGKGVKTADKNRVLLNLQGVMDVIAAQEPDFVFLQELDRHSYRSEYVDELEMISDYLTAAGMELQETFACNFNVDFIPYPIPPIGEVYSGIATLSNYEITDAERISLPSPFTWPVRIGNLKRCLLVTRCPVVDENGEDTGRELVLVNLHLEAYDDGEGKIAQTKLLKEVFDAEVAKGNYVIAGGDFNQTFSGVDISAYPAYPGMWEAGLIDENEFGAEYSFLMDNTYPTCRSLDKVYAGADHSTFQYYMLDGFIISSNIEAEAQETLDHDFVSTDHNPVRLSFVLR